MNEGSNCRARKPTRYPHRKGARLSVWNYREIFEKTFLGSQVTLLIAETGSGKSTQIPQFIDEILNMKYGGCRGNKMVVCTQPRRIAVFNLSRRVAEEMGVKLGTYVGYGIRFEDCSSSETRIKFLTDSLLLRYVMSDPTFENYECVIIDEIHERTCSTDILLGLISLALPKNKNMKVVLMSATINVDPFVNFFSNVSVINVLGRSYPVTIEYLPKPPRDYLVEAVKTVLEINENQPMGDILVFLNGKAEIDMAYKMIEEAPKSVRLIVYKMHSNVSEDKLLRVFSPTKCRKVVLATNMAETSLTIESIVYVVDCGFFKQKIYHPRIHTESLLITPISKASAIQRAGRAGRVRPGRVYRLYTVEAYEELIPETHPEILRSSLESVVLTLKMCGIRDLIRFPFLSPPAPETLIYAIESLYYLGVMDNEGELTMLGRLVSEFPLEPAQAVAIHASIKYSCSMQVINIISLLSSPSVFVYPGDENLQKFDLCKDQFSNIMGDHLTLLNIFESYIHHGRSREWCFKNFLDHRSLEIAEKISAQINRILRKNGIGHKNQDRHSPLLERSIIKSLASGFFLNTVFLDSSNRYLTIKDLEPINIHPNSVIKGHYDYLFYNKAIISPQSWITTVSIIDLNTLVQVAPEYFHPNNFSDPVKNKIIQIKNPNYT